MDPRQPWRWWMTFRDERGKRWSAWRMRGIKSLQSRFMRRAAHAMIVFSAVLWVGVFIAGYALYRRIRAELTPLDIEIMRAAAGEQLHKDARGMVGGLLVNAFLLLLLLLMVRATAWRRAKKCLAKRICPMCAYRLEGLRPEGDGCTICPECGAAWSTEGNLGTAFPQAQPG